MKIMIVNGIAILFVVLLVTMTQTRMFIQISEEECIANLCMLTNQVCLNFGENQENITDTIYDRTVTFQIPKMMAQYEENQEALESAVTEMVTHSTDYNYVMLEMLDGQRINSGSQYLVGRENFSVIRDNCKFLLDTYTEKTYGSNIWYRLEDGGVYILKDVYDVQPLQYVGRMVVHLKDNPFEISDIYTDNSFMFFDSKGNYLTSAGKELSGTVEEAFVEVFQNQDDLSYIEIDGGTYYVDKDTRDGWTAMGISTMESYHKVEDRIACLAVVFGILGFLLGMVIVFVLLKKVVKKLKQLQQSMNEVAQGNLDSSVAVQGEDDISQLAATFNYMTNRISELLDELIQKERAKKDVEIEMLEYKYRSLQTQIRPHFIYNALETIGALAKMHRYEEIEKAVLHISRYFRNITMNTTKNFITVQQEFDSLRDYTEIYGFIHGNHLETVYSAREQAKNAMVPTMIVQPLVENALKYGVRDQTEKSQICIHAYKKGEELYITIKDNVYGLSEEVVNAFRKNQKIPSREQSGIGISNVKERLYLIYGDRSKLDVHNRECGGVKVTIVIPFSCQEPELETSSVLEELEELNI